MKRAAVLFLVLFACGKTAALDESEKRKVARTTEPTPPWRLVPDPNGWEAAESSYQEGLAARDRGDHALAEEKLLEAARLRRPNGLALARAGLAALARGAEARANDLFREALVDLEQQTRERPHPAAHVPLACWGVFSTSVELRWRDNRHLELRCRDGVSVVDVPAHEEVERYPMDNGVHKPAPVKLVDHSYVGTSDGWVTFTDAESGRMRAKLRGTDFTILDDGGVAVNDGSSLVYYDARLVERRRIEGYVDARPSRDGRSFAYLVTLPNPESDAFHVLAPHVRDIATGEDIDLSDVLHESSRAYVRGRYVSARTTSPGVITRGFQRFAWSVDIDGNAWNWNDEVRCDGDANAQEGDLLRCLAPYGPLVLDERATVNEVHCRVGRHVLPVVVCSVGFGPSRSPLVTR